MATLQGKVKVLSFSICQKITKVRLARAEQLLSTALRFGFRLERAAESASDARFRVENVTRKRRGRAVTYARLLTGLGIAVTLALHVSRQSRPRHFIFCASLFFFSQEQIESHKTQKKEIRKNKAADKKNRKRRRISARKNSGDFFFK
jgi:hypothetical protein